MFGFEGEEHQDSFQVQELNRRIPEPMPVHVGRHDYELTFKKDQQGQYFIKNARSSTSKVLFSPSDRVLLARIAEPVPNFYEKSLQELSCLPYADLYCLELGEGHRLKLKLIGEIVEVKRLRLKISSANVNIRCLRNKQNRTQEDQHRLYLLELLWKQLNKKVFIEALKLNRTEVLYSRGGFEEAQDQINNYTSQQNAQHIRQQFIQEREQDDQSLVEWQKHRYVDNYQQKQQIGNNQIVILNQIITSIIKRSLFIAFSNLLKCKSSNKQLKNKKDANIKTSENKDQSRISVKQEIEQQDERQKMQQDKRMILMPSDRKPYEYLSPSQQNYQQEEEQQINQSHRLEELCQYIEELHQQCADAEDLLLKYFIKWKIYVLESIAQSRFIKIRDHQNIQQSQQRNEQSQRHNPKQTKHIQVHDNSEVLSNSNYFLSQASDSRLNSQMISGQGSLKEQKRQLKHFIKINRSRIFVNKLRDAFEISRITSICKQVRNQNILKKAFLGFRLNRQEEKRLSEMQDYFKEVSDHQYEDDGASRLFHKTNLLYRYFKNMQKYIRNSKVCKLIDRVIQSFAFRKLVEFSQTQKRFYQLQVRQIQKTNSRLEFKYFRIWKQVYYNSRPYFAKLKQYFKTKDRQKLAYYFSIFSYHYKVSRVQQKKAQKYYSSKLYKKIFYSLKRLAEEGRQAKEALNYLSYYLRLKRATSFLDQFKKFYDDTIQHQRFAIKQEKLRRSLLKLQAVKGIRQWRKLHLRRSTYQLIQNRLARLKIKQRKREIFHLWHNRTFDHQHRYSSNKSEQHKDWLVRYYGDLCSVVPQ